ncbi:MAG: hypothetical protein E6K80_06855, partial [Candidatus Eisenbacteria bacterium]
WSLRQSLGNALAAHLSHFAKYGTPDDPDDGIAMSEFFLETLVADDDDGNLANGTPHFAQIEAAFDAHGIGTSFYLSIAHTPLADQPASGPRVATAHVTYGGPFGALDPGSPTIHYAIDGEPESQVAMTALGGGDYSASLPQASGTIIRYWLSAADVSGGMRTDPPGAPAWSTHAFLAGAVTQALANDMETDPGWTVGAPGDAATTGVWIRAEPVGSSENGIQIQPELDHTVDPGSLCFVTGNAAPTDPIGTADVDGGATTLLTSVFSAAGLTNPVIEYWRWYTNNGGNDAGTDLCGSTWAPIESTRSTDNSWRRVLVRIADLLPPTATMRVRFVASDVGASSVVEAAVDDFRLLALPVTTGVTPAAAPLALVLDPARPNPFASATSLRYALPRATDVTLTIHDIEGRVVRTLERGPATPGAHVARWDGRDDRGRVVPDGVYYARLIANETRLVRPLVRIR